VVNQMLATVETAELAANIIGYLAQQEMVWVNKLKPQTKDPKAYGIMLSGEGMDDSATVIKLWGKILENDTTDLMQGYQPVVAADGQPGILVLVEKGDEGPLTGDKESRDVRTKIDGEVKTLLENVIEWHDGDIMAEYSEAEIYKAGTKGAYDGEAYLERIQSAGRHDLIPALRNYRRELEEEFGRQVSGIEGKAKKGSTSKNALVKDGEK